MGGREGVGGGSRKGWRRGEDGGGGDETSQEGIKGRRVRGRREEGGAREGDGRKIRGGKEKREEEDKTKEGGGQNKHHPGGGERSVLTRGGPLGGRLEVWAKGGRRGGGAHGGQVTTPTTLGICGKRPSGHLEAVCGVSTVHFSSLTLTLVNITRHPPSSAYAYCVLPHTSRLCAESLCWTPEPEAATP